MTAQELYEECFGQVWPQLESNYHDKEVEIIFSLDSGHDQRVDTKTEMFCTVLQHQLTMALTQTLRGTEVRISLGAAQKCCVLTVRDHGPGMSPDQAHKLYQLATLEDLGVKVKVSSREFMDFPDDHGTSVISIF